MLFPLNDTPLLAAGFFILLILLRHPFKRKFSEDIQRHRLYWGGGILIIVAQIFPLVGSSAINHMCSRSTRQNAVPLIEAIEIYFERNGAYPAEVEVLLKEYLVDLPVPGCYWLTTHESWPLPSYEIQTCGDGTVLLTNESVDGTSIERYNLSTGIWSSISFLDGSCSHLR